MNQPDPIENEYDPTFWENAPNWYAFNAKQLNHLTIIKEHGFKFFIDFYLKYEPPLLDADGTETSISVDMSQVYQAYKVMLKKCVSVLLCHCGILESKNSPIYAKSIYESICIPYPYFTHKLFYQLSVQSLKGHVLNLKVELDSRKARLRYVDPITQAVSLRHYHLPLNDCSANLAWSVYCNSLQNFFNDIEAKLSK